MTTLLPPYVKVHLTHSYVDTRKGVYRIGMLIQGVLFQYRFMGHLFLSITRDNLIKIICLDGTGFSLFSKRLSTVSFSEPTTALLL